MAQYYPGTTKVAKNRNRFSDPDVELEKLREISDEAVVNILGHRAPGEEYPSVHPPLEEMDEPDDAIREMVVPLDGAKAGDRVRYIQFSDSMYFAPAHSFVRSRRLALRIGRKERADLGVVELAALLHDIGREEADRSHGRVCHGRHGAALARRILVDYGCEPAVVRAVVEAIRTHRFRRGGTPRTLEARILFDADKLDSIGAVGVGRAFLFAGEIGARLHDKAIDVAKTEPYTLEDTAYREYLVKLGRVKDRMMTREGRRVAAERHRYMAAFFDRLNKETDGTL